MPGPPRPVMGGRGESPVRPYSELAMTTPEIIGLIALGVAGLLLVLILLPKLVLRFMRGPLESRIAARYAEHDVLLKDLTANCFGLESAGKFQVRGNGALVLTAKVLHFFMFLPRKEFVVPLEAITEITFTRRHLGKATIHNLLKVRFMNEGKADSLAWYVADPEAWKGRIEEMTAGNAARQGLGSTDQV